MKKVITFLIAVSVVFCVAASEKPAEAQIPYGGYCCDAAGWRRCVLDSLYPLGSACWCNYQGAGWVCR